MKKHLTMLVLAVLAASVIGGCSSSSAPTGDAQMDKYNENLKGAKELGAEQPADQNN